MGVGRITEVTGLQFNVILGVVSNVSGYPRQETSGGTGVMECGTGTKETRSV